MSMYLLNNPITVNWRLEPKDVPIPLASLDLYILPPVGLVQYIPAAIGAEDYIAPTGNAFGMLSYILTPTILGLWTITLTDGTEIANTIYYSYRIQVSINDTFTQKFVPGNLF